MPGTKLGPWDIEMIKVRKLSLLGKEKTTCPLIISMINSLMKAYIVDCGDKESV